MVDTIRPQADHIANFPDGTTGHISAQDARDLIVSAIPGGRIADQIIASSTHANATLLRANADQRPDGTADQTDFNTSLTALNGTYGGLVRASSGLFTFSAPLTLISNVALEGVWGGVDDPAGSPTAGRGTVITLANSANANMFELGDTIVNVHFRRLAFHGNKGNQGATSHCIYSDSAVFCSVERCWFQSFKGVGLYLDRTTGSNGAWHILFNNFRGCDSQDLYLDSGVSDCFVLGNEFLTSAVVNVYCAGGFNHFVGNHIGNAGTHGMQIFRGDHNTLSGNNFNKNNRHNLLLQECSMTSVSGGQMRSASNETDNTYDHIRVTCDTAGQTCDYNNMVGIVFSKASGVTNDPKYCIQEVQTAGITDFNNIVACVLNDGQTGQTLLVGASSQRRSCIGQADS
jgi:hypothetical protein